MNDVNIHNFLVNGQLKTIAFKIHQVIIIITKQIMRVNIENNRTFTDHEYRTITSSRESSITA